MITKLRAGFLLLFLSLACAIGDSKDIRTDVFVVRPDFLEKIEEAGPPPKLQEATEALKKQGIEFPPGTSATYNPATSQLTVRNTGDQMELVATLVDQVNGMKDIQVYLTVREVTLSKKSAEDVGFDWLVPANPETIANAPFQSRGLVMDSRQSFFEEFSRPPTIPEAPEGEAALPDQGISGVFTDPQFQVMIRALNQQKGVEILSAPSVVTRSGDPAFVQVEEKRWGIIPTIGGDEFTLDLDLYLPQHGKALFEKGEKPSPTARITIWDGQTVAWSERNDEKSLRTVFIKASLIDPAGTPINDNGSTHSIALSADDTIQDLKGAVTYEIKKGDSLFSVAKEFHVSTKRLRDANSLTSDVLEVGQKLKIPPPR